MATKLQIYNSVLTGLGERRLAALTDNSENRRKLDAVWDEVFYSLLTDGPEEGWKFATKRNVAVDRESTTITAFSDYNSIVATTTLVQTKTEHNLVTGNDVAIDDTTNYDGDYDDITVVAPNQFYLSSTSFSSNDATGTVYWISDNYRYRFKTPDGCYRVLRVMVGGVELTDWFEEEGFILTNNEDATIYIDYIKDIQVSEAPYYFDRLLNHTLQAELGYPLVKSSTHAERLMKKADDTLLWAIARDNQKRYVQNEDRSWVEAGR